jgi:putative transposase
MVAQITQLQQQHVPVRRSCNALDFPTSSYYDRCRPPRAQRDAMTRTSARALTPGERHTVRALLNSDSFVDQSPREVYATLLDSGRYYCSVSTMYRILAAHGEVRERRSQRQHPPRQKPQLLAAAPNQLWSWDITKLRSPTKYVFFYLYVILDVFSRYAVGWMIAEQESAALAQQLIVQSCQQQQIAQEQLTLHADRGSPMVALTTAQLLEKLGVQKTHSRPYTPNDLSTQYSSHRSKRRKM